MICPECKCLRPETPNYKGSRRTCNCDPKPEAPTLPDLSVKSDLPPPEGKPEAPTDLDHFAGMIAGTAPEYEPAKAQAPGAREWWICKHGEDIVHNLKSRWVSEVPIEIKTAEYFHVIEYAAYEALEARNKTLEELVKQDYDSTARDAQVIEALERELAEACAARDQWRSAQQALNQARAELAEARALHDDAVKEHDEECERSAALVEAGKELVEIIEDAEARKQIDSFTTQPMREVLNKYGGGE